MKFILHQKKQEETFFTDPKGPVCPTLGSKKYSVNPENNLVSKNGQMKKKCAQKLKRTRNLDQWDKKWEKMNGNVLLQ